MTYANHELRIRHLEIVVAKLVSAAETGESELSIVAITLAGVVFVISLATLGYIAYRLQRDNWRALRRCRDRDWVADEEVELQVAASPCPSPCPSQPERRAVTSDADDMRKADQSV